MSRSLAPHGPGTAPRLGRRSFAFWLGRAIALRLGRAAALRLGLLSTAFVGAWPGAVAPPAAFAQEMPPAQPLIRGVFGERTNGARLEIHGASFGEKVPSGAVLYDRIDNIAAYSKRHLKDGARVPVVADGGCADCPWEEGIPEDWGMRPVLALDSPHARVAGRPAYRVSQKGYFRGPNPLARLDESGVVYLTWWMRANHPLFDVPGRDPVWNKLLRFTAGNSSEDWKEQVEIEPQNCYGSRKACGEPGWDWFGGYDELSPGAWHRIEMLIEGGGNLKAGSGRVDVLIDGARVSGSSTLYSCHGMLDHIFVWGSDPSAPSSYPADSEILFSELYLDTTRARVILSDSRAYAWPGAAAVAWEIQPIVEWSDERITIVFDRGAFPADRPVYLYVIDGSGAVSPPFALNAS